MVFDSWESYFYPETFDGFSGTLRNKLGERDADVLREFEYAATFERQRELTSGEIQVPRTYDGQHLRAIHRHLFQDVYEWAGQYRTVNIAKGSPRGFADVSTGEVDRYLADAHRLVAMTDWERIDRSEFAARAADIFAHVNQAHPFREGNGRASKVFMEHVAEQSPYGFEWDRVTPEIWNQASMLSEPDVGRYEPVPDSLVPVFEHITIDRPDPPEPTTETVEQASPHLALDNSLRAAALARATRREQERAMGPGRDDYGYYRPGQQVDGPDRTPS